MKRIALITVLLTACGGDDVTRPDGVTGEYSLVSMGGVTLPVAYEREMVGTPGVMCVDSLFAHEIHLRNGGDAEFETDQQTFCPGRAPVQVGTRLPGTWTARGDSVFIITSAASPSGPVSVDWNGSLEGDDLIFRHRVFTEEDPDGTSGLTYDQIYRRQR